MADVYSIAGNRLRPYTEIGMPYHGLATNGTLPTSDGDKTIPQTSFFGPCQLIRHPLAPGVDRNPNQIANDTAKGFDWRNYALLTGTGHGVNGSTELGATKWLYCDDGGNTWVIGINSIQAGEQEQVTHIGEFVEHLTFPVTNSGTLNNDQLLIQVVLEGIWGRFGVPYAVDPPRLLGEFIWTPDIPSWYGGAFTAEDVIANIDLAGPSSLVVNPSGASALLHLNMKENTQGDLISSQVYEETQRVTNGANGTFPEGSALVGIVSIDITGIGDKNDNGNGITASIQDDLRYESGLIQSREKIVNGSTGTEDWTVTQEPFPPCPVAWDGNNEVTTSYNPGWAIQNNGDTSGTTGSNEFRYVAVLYKTFDGTVRRTYETVNQGRWQVDWTNTTSDNWNLSNDPTSPGGVVGCTPSGEGGNWYLVDCTSSGYLIEERTTSTFNKQRVEYDIFGRIYNFDLEDDDGGYVENEINISRPPSCPVPPYTSNNFLFRNSTLNGQVLENWAPCYHEYRTAAPNDHYVVIDQPQLTGTDRDMIENVVVINEAGVASEQVDKTTPHAPRPIDRQIPDLRELALTYQPVTEQFTSGPALLFTANPNDIFQYV